jgi:hypothetical protein
MGIYSDGHIYGVRLIGAETVVFENTWPEPIDASNLTLIKNYYNGLTTLQKKGLNVSFYQSMSSTYDVDSQGKYMGWVPGSLTYLFQTSDE